MTKKLLMFLLLTGLVLTTLSAQEVGEVTFLNGDVEIIRNGEIISFDDIDIGTPVENYDMITTASGSTISIKIQYGGSNSEIIVDADTTFAVEIDENSSGSTTNLNMFSGGLALKVQKLTSGNGLNVNTESASMGVRGTTFNVEASPGGDVLVSCEEGRVQCSANGRKIDVKPGNIVEQTVDGDFRSIPVAVSSLKSFRENWMDEKLEVFKTDALRAIKQYANRYDDLYEKFNQAYDELAAHKEIISRWYQEDKKGQIGGNMELMRDKKIIVAKLMAIRARLVIFEKIYFRLLELERYYQQGYGKGEIRPGLSSRNFFIRFDREKRELKQKMAVVKHVIKMFVRRNNGSFPADGISGDDDGFFSGEDEDDDDDFFNDF